MQELGKWPLKRAERSGNRKKSRYLVQLIEIGHQVNVDAITHLWRDLHGRLAPDNPFTGPEWSGFIFKTQNGNRGQRLWLVKSCEQGKEAVLPLRVHRTFQFGLPSQRVESIGLGNSPHRQHYVYAQEPLVEPDAWRLLLDGIRQLGQWNLFRMAPLPENHPTIASLARLASDQNLIFFRRPYARGFKIVVKDGSWEDYQNSRSKKFLKSIRSAAKKLTQHFDVKIVAYQKPHDKVEMTEALRAISKNSWKADIGSDLFNESHRSFYRLALTHFLDAGQSLVWVLYAGKRPIAFEWHLRHNRRSIALKADYDKAYSTFSPGNVLAWYACRSCFEDGLDEVDYLFGGSAYKQRWATAEYLLEEIMLFKKDLYSRIVYETFKRRGWFQKLWRFNSKWRLQSKKT